MCPGGALLSVDCPIGVSDSIGIKRAIWPQIIQIITEIGLRPITVDHTVDDDVGNMNTLGAIFPRQRLSQIA